jgi:hypothetical protein
MRERLPIHALLIFGLQCSLAIFVDQFLHDVARIFDRCGERQFSPADDIHDRRLSPISFFSSLFD